jgi:hypothetical protein
MRRIAIYSTFCFLCFSPAAFADCEKHDLPEVATWSASKLDAEYCKAFNEKHQRVAPRFTTMSEMYYPSGLPTPQGQAWLAEIGVCLRQTDLYLKVLKDVHQKTPPFCLRDGQPLREPPAGKK